MKTISFIILLFSTSGFCSAYDHFAYYDYLIHISHLSSIKHITDKYELTEEDRTLINFHIDSCKSFVYKQVEDN